MISIWEMKCSEIYLNISLSISTFRWTNREESKIPFTFELSSAAF